MLGGAWCGSAWRFLKPFFFAEWKLCANLANKSTWRGEDSRRLLLSENETMEITFCIEYRTAAGERLVVNVENGEDAAGRHVMHSDDNVMWHCSVTAKARRSGSMRYHYSVERGGHETRSEWTLVKHGVDFADRGVARYDVRDWWIDRPAETYQYSLAFTECMAAHGYGKFAATAGRCVVVKVRAPQLLGNQRLVLACADEALGAWSVERGTTMTQVRPNEWVAAIDADKLGRQLMEFKFVAVVPGHEQDAKWELGKNRVMLLPEPEKGVVTVAEQIDARFDMEPLRVAGTVIPVFSLRSERSMGVGDFGDLKKMIDWVAMTGQHALQLLPINDTTMDYKWTDSYPYNCISVCALHPLYADVSQLPPLRDESLKRELERERAELNALPQVDYERTIRAKMRWLRATYGESGEQMLASQGFKRYFAHAKGWLVPYAAFCTYRDRYGTPDSSRWSARRTANAKELAAMGNSRNKAFWEVAFWYYVQFNLHLQMTAAHEHARAKKVALKGDIPIGVSRCGADVWQSPEYFNMNGQAGAPPDAFSTKGQNWGFPTYNWEVMKKDGYKWWKNRFEVMEKYFDAYRMDHVLGFFRIWEIPIDAVEGLLGQFSPALGMTCAEIEGYGLRFDPKRHAEPLITDGLLAQQFGERAADVKKQYLTRKGDGTYRLKPSVATQRKIETAVTDGAVREGLYALVADVLFVKDRADGHKYHPRIMGSDCGAYGALAEGDKAAFDRLYDDYYYHRNSQFWYDEAMMKLPALVETTRMLACAEDLGMVPECVPWVLDRLGILSLEIESMPKAFGQRFGDTASYPYRSVCTIATHDMPTLRQWWSEDKVRTQAYYNTVLRHDGTAPQPLPGWIAAEVVRNHLKSKSMLCLLSWQDWLATDEALRAADADTERINVPSEPRHYWRWRMHLTLEQLMQAEEFNSKVRSMIKQCGRACGA